MGDLTPYIEEACVIGCSRCSTEATYFGLRPELAAAFFAEAGWTREDEEARVWIFCPACNGNKYGA